MKSTKWKVTRTSLRGPVSWVFTIGEPVHLRDARSNQRVRNWLGAHFILSITPIDGIPDEPRSSNPNHTNT